MPLRQQSADRCGLKERIPEVEAEVQVLLRPCRGCLPRIDAEHARGVISKRMTVCKAGLTKKPWISCAVGYGEIILNNHLRFWTGHGALPGLGAREG